MYLGPILNPIVPAEEWAKIYGLDIEEIECSLCGEPIILNIPFATKEFRGFHSKQCPCGNEDIPFVFIHKNEI